MKSASVSCASALWVLGYPARAAARMREGLALARSLAHPFSLAHSYRFGAAFHLSRRERDAVQEQADASFALSTEHGFDAVLKAAAFTREGSSLNRAEERPAARRCGSG